MEKVTVTNITGLVMAILAIVSGIGVLSAEESAVLTKWIPVIIEAISAIVLVFLAKDKQELW
jgi:hypothetical protein